MSWQYHQRRSETWKILEGPVGIVRSETNIEGETKEFNSGETVTLKKEERHRLVGLNNWSIVAEFWQHTDEDNPSDEQDIVRVQDYYSR